MSRSVWALVLVAWNAFPSQAQNQPFAPGAAYHPQADLGSTRILTLREIVMRTLNCASMLIPLVASLILGLAPTATLAQASECDRACLQRFMDDYLTALAQRDPSRLPVAENVKFTENGRVLNLGLGFWLTSGAPTGYRDTLIDPDTGGVAVLTAFTQHDAVVQMFVRLKVENRLITEIETFAVRAGDHRWFAPQDLDALSDLFAQAVPHAERHTRAELIAAAAAYFDAIETEGTPAFVQAPFAPGMKRIENGLQTTNVTENPRLERHTWSADLQLERASYAGTRVHDRRYPVVDVERGSVLAVAAFRREGEHTPITLLAEIFKYTENRLQEIRAVILNLPNGAGTGWSAP